MPLPRRALLAAAAGLLLARSLAARDAPATRYETRPANPGGTGRFYMGREIAGVMGWEGAAWLERENREREERTDLLVNALPLKPGMDVADVGAGTGYFARRMARRVAPGTVYATDLQPQMLRMVEHLAQRDGLANLRTVASSEQDVGLAPASIDLALLVDVYHELAWPHEVMASLVRALRPGGRVVLVEYRAEDPKVPIVAIHKMSQAQLRREMAPHALVHERTSNALPWQHLVVFRKTG